MLEMQMHDRNQRSPDYFFLRLVFFYVWSWLGPRPFPYPRQEIKLPLREGEHYEDSPG